MALGIVLPSPAVRCRIKPAQHHTCGTVARTPEAQPSERPAAAVLVHARPPAGLPDPGGSLMHTRHATHPALHELAAFALGKLPQAEATLVARHLEACPLCAEAVTK